MLRKLLTSTLCFTAVASTAFSTENHKPMRASLRHIEKGGVGYKDGYSTLELFLAPSPDAWNIMPFVDLRGHVFNDGNLATNTGLGLRTLAGCRVYGINAYYDYRNTNHQHYNQVALGLETLGISWDFRINGYLPVGDKRSSSYERHKPASYTFDSFRGNYALLKKTIKTSVEYAMKGIDSEASFHFLKNKNIDLYAATGPYYYNYQSKQAIGGKVRLGTQIYEYLSLELINSYDSRFHENFQGQIGLNIPLGPRQKPEKNKKMTSCNNPSLLAQRLVQDVQRQEIVVVDKFHQKKVAKETPIAINPQTGLPYSFFFVDNTSHSNGTYESPFNALIDAQNASSPNDVIYVFPGDGSGANMNTGIVLQDNQMLLGASTIHPLSTTVGSISIPALSSVIPIIANAGSVVTLSNNNTVSGLYLIGSFSEGSCLFGDGIANLTATQNIIAEAPNGIQLSSCSGDITIDNNTISYINYYGVLLNNNSSINLLSISGTTISSSGTDGIFLDTGSSVSTLNISASNFLHNYNNGIKLNTGGSVSNLNISGSSFFFNGTLSGTGYGITLDSGCLVTNMNISRSSFGNNSTQGFYVGVNNSISNFTISNSTFNYNFESGVYLDTGTSITDLTLSGSSFNSNEGDGVYLGGSISNLEILNSNFNSNRPSGYAGVHIAGPIETVTISKSHFDGNGYCGIYLDSTGSIANNLLIANSSFNKNGNAGIALLGGGSITNNLSISECSFHANSTGIYIGGSLSTLTISDSSFIDNNTDSGAGIILDSGANCSNLIVSESSFLSNGVGSILQNPGIPLDSLTISGSNFSYSGSSTLLFYGTVNNVTLSNSQFNNNYAGPSFTSISTATITECDFNNNAAGPGLSIGTVSNLIISECSVYNNQNTGISAAVSTSATITDNRFYLNGPQDVVDLSLMISGTDTDVNISNNTFTSLAYGLNGSAQITLTSGDSTCLNFIGNSANPTNQDLNPGAPAAVYTWTNNSELSDFGVTSGSTSANNVGIINSTGTSAPGSCSLP